MKCPRRKGGNFYAQAIYKNLRWTILALRPQVRSREQHLGEALPITLSSEAAQATSQTSVLKPQTCHILYTKVT